MPGEQQRREREQRGEHVGAPGHPRGGLGQRRRGGIDEAGGECGPRRQRARAREPREQRARRGERQRVDEMKASPAASPTARHPRDSSASPAAATCRCRRRSPARNPAPAAATSPARAARRGARSGRDRPTRTCSRACARRARAPRSRARATTPARPNVPGRPRRRSASSARPARRDGPPAGRVTRVLRRARARIHPESPVSRILYGSLRGDHLTGTMVSHRLVATDPGVITGRVTPLPLYAVLLRTGFGEPALSPALLVSSYLTVSPLPAAASTARWRRVQTAR